MAAKILIIEDEDRMRRLMQLMLEDKGYAVKTGKDGEEGIQIWRQWHPDVVLSDLKMPKKDGIQVLQFKNANDLSAPLIILTAFGTIDSAVAAVKKGAFDYLTKPVMNEQVEEAIENALKYIEKNIHNHRSEVSKARMPGKIRMVGTSSAIESVREAISRVAQTSTTVLITGESGVGKELVANSIHTQSDRCGSALIKINCPAIPKDLIETELFGHRKGAFTGAVSSRLGAFEKADRGTLFLDEIGDLPLELQPKLLHAVEEKIISPVGGETAKIVDVRIIAATNQDLPKMVEAFKFRGDLYYRLNTYQINVPPLRERIDDIPELCAYFINYFCKKMNRSTPQMRPDGLQLLKKYHWPGNVRELRNVIERCVLDLRGNQLGSSDVPDQLCKIIKNGVSTPVNDRFDLQAQEKKLIIDALKKTGWNYSRTAKVLNITRNTLRYRLKKFGIQRR